MGPERVVYLSTIGAQAREGRTCSRNTGIIEKELGELAIPITFSAGRTWFMENSLRDVAPARERRVIPSFLQPVGRPVPMVATADIGRVAAEVLQTAWNGRRVMELEGPRRVTPDEIAAIFAELLGHPVRTEVVSRETWEPLFRSQGMKNPEPRIRMLDGFNEGWIEFEGGESGSRRGNIGIGAVLKALIERE